MVYHAILVLHCSNIRATAKRSARRHGGIDPRYVLRLFSPSTHPAAV